MRCICFTGHRSISNTPYLQKHLLEQIENCVQGDAIVFYAGGAFGWDLLCEQCVLQLQKIYPQIRLHLILPCPPEIQTAIWTQQQKEIFQLILQEANDIEVVSECYTKNCMRERNERLVALSDACICYYNEKRFRSGTGQTVRLAQKKGIPIVNLFLL